MQNEDSQYKYNIEDKNCILNKGRGFGSVYEGDLIKDILESQGFNCKKANVNDYSEPLREPDNSLDQFTYQDYINEKALIGLGTTILENQLTKKCNGYVLSIPSREVPYGTHAVAMMVDDKNKKVSYHDSHGDDMPKAMKDYLALLLPKYEISVDQTKLQEDVKVFVPGSEENDQSCACLALYNLRDMWYRRSGREDEVCQFKSMEARTDAWNRLKNTKKEPEVKTTKKIRIIPKPGFSFGATSKPEPWTEEKKAFGKKEQERLFNYRLENEPDYQDRLQSAVKTTRSNHQMYLNNLANQGAVRR